MAGALCSRSCDVGYFCDPGTSNCETCDSICNPLRNTMDECLSTKACQDYWPLSRTVSSLIIPTSTEVNPESSKVILFTVTIVGSIIALSLISALIYRLTTKKFTFKCWVSNKPQPAVQLSLPEQRRTNKLVGGGNPYLLVTYLLPNSPDRSSNDSDQRMDAV